MLLAERDDVGEKVIGRVGALAAEVVDGAAEIDGIERVTGEATRFSPEAHCRGRASSGHYQGDGTLSEFPLRRARS